MIGKRLLDQHRSEAIQAYLGGSSAKVIGDTYGVSKFTTVSWLREQGVAIRSKAEQNALISKKLSGVPKTEEMKAKVRESLTGRVMPEETKKKLSKALKGRVISEETKEKLKEGQARRNARPGEGELRSERLRKLWQDPAYREKMSKARSKQATKRWSEGNWRNSTRVSKVEYEFAPYIQKRGFTHNVDGGIVITSGSKSRTPDFYNLATKQVVEVWEKNWHEGEDPKVLQQWYRRRGWSATVFWEDEISSVVKSGERPK